MDSSASMMLNVLFSAIGMGFFVYGKKQKVLIPALSGIGLMGFPYFVESIPLMMLTGVVLMAIPYFYKL